MTHGTAAAPEEAPPQPPPRRLRFAALEVPRYRWYWIFSALSNMGDGIAHVIQNVLILQLVGPAAAPLWLAAAVMAHWIPFTGFSLYGGALADRYDARRVLTAGQLLLMASTLMLAATTLLDVVSVWWIVGMLLLHGLGGALGGPAQQTLIHSIVGKERLLSAVSLNSTIRQFTQLLGPAIAGVIIVTLGPGWGFAIDALTFIPLLAFLSLLRLGRVADAAVRPAAVALREGLGFVRARPRIASLIGIEMLTVIFLGHTFNTYLVLFATQILGTSTLGYSFLLVASGLGGLAAAVFLAVARQRRSPGLFIAATAAVQMAAIFAFALSRSYALSFALMIVVGAMAVLTQSYTNTTIQLAAPDRIRGRVMGAYYFGTQGLRIFNGPILGSLALWLGTPVAVASSAGLVLVALGAIVLAVPQLREAS